MMTNLQALITLLSDGRCYSGERIGQHFGISRAAVWKQLQKLLGLGLVVDSVKGKGYQLREPLELLDYERITEHLKLAVREKIAAFDLPMIVDSTNNYALAQCASLLDGQAYICLAEQQTEGRGRRGRQWVSPFGRNIYVSFAWQFEGGASELGGLSLAVGVVLVEILQRQGVEQVKLKWPNDILLGGKKLGGILLEMRGDPAGQCQVVIGIGVNVSMMGEQNIDQEWVALSSVVDTLSRNELSAEIINGVIQMLASYSSQGLSHYLASWRELDAFYGCRVNVTSGAQSHKGIACGVAEDGALVVEVDGERQCFHGGEISLRLDEKYDS